MARILILMGASGCGKTVVMEDLRRRLGWPAAEGDDFHSPENVAKMSAGVALTDEDRKPWLAAIAAWIGEREAAGQDALVACSALKRSYRDVLRHGHPGVSFIFLKVPRDVLAERMTARKHHYMPVSLLDSQLATLEPLAPDEPGLTVDANRPLDRVVADILAWLGPRVRPRTKPLG